MKTHAGGSAPYRARADKLLSETGLPSDLSRYGEVRILGIDKKGGHIDIQVICASCDDKKVQQIFNDISYRAAFDSYYFGNKGSARLRRKLPGIYHIGMAKSVEGAQHRVDVWFVPPDEAKKHGGAIDVARPVFYRLGRSRGLQFASSLGDSAAARFLVYGLIGVFIFTVTVGVFNYVFNGELGFGAFSRQAETAEEFVAREEAITESAEAPPQQSDAAEKAKEAAEPPAELDEGAFEGAFEKQLPSFPDIPIELPSRGERTGTEDFPETVFDPVEDAEFVNASPELPENCNFTENLRIGDISDDVERLQMFLSFQGDAIYPEGIVSGWFGNLTRAAVIRFQETYSKDILGPWELDKGTGFVGPTTRAKAIELCGLQKN